MKLPWRNQPMRLARSICTVLAIAALGGCAATSPASRAPIWSGPPAEIPTNEEGGYFGPSPALQFLVDPYPREDGPSWLGADVGTSVRVDQDRYIWIFGDTLLGRVKSSCPDEEIYCDRVVDHGDDVIGMIRNTVGVTERAPDGSFRRIVKYWPSATGDPHDALPSGVEGQFLWPLAGIRAGEPVLIAANRHTPASGLAPVGNVIVRIANPDDEPQEWRLTLHELPNFRDFGGPEPSLVWTMALARIGRHVYVFGELGSAFDAKTVLARLDLEDVARDAWTPTPEYLMRDARGHLHWSEDFDAERLHIVRGLPGTSETTVFHDDELGWYSYQIPPLEFDVHLYTAPDLEGPWYDSGVVYRLPPPWSTEENPECGEGAFTCKEYVAYAAKAHPELGPPGSRVLTYNVNLASGSLRGAKLAAEKVRGFYVPQMVVGPNGTPDSAGRAAAQGPHE